jgi:hypothetical protein
MFGTSTAIVLLIAFLVPGYIWRTVEGQFVYLDHRLPWEKFALGLLTRSTLLYLPWASAIYGCWKSKWYESHAFCASLIIFAFLVAVPVFVGLVTGILRQKDFIGTVFEWKWVDAVLSRLRLKALRSHGVPTAWEAVFNSRMTTYWVIVTRKNGQVVRGELGIGSHISVDPEDRDMFLSKTLYWDDTNKRWDPVPGTRGVYIGADEIATIEMVAYGAAEVPHV